MQAHALPDSPRLEQDTSGAFIPPLATAAALDNSSFSRINATEAIPATWEERAAKAWEYYIEEPLVKNCINSWRTFAVGDEIKLASDDEDLKNEATDAAEELSISQFVKDMILQLLVKGDAIGFKRTGRATGIEELVCVNPISVKVKYANGELIEAKQFPEADSGGGDIIDLPVEQVIHLKWDAPSFSPRGNSLVLPAFQSIELLRDYRKAEQAIAKRWTTPFRLIKVGGAFGQKMVMPEQKMLEQVRDMVNKMDIRSGLVVPFYVTVETHGTDGQVLNVEDKVKEVKEDIVVALGLSRSLVTGDGPNFATASVSMQKMMVMIREIKQAARKLLNWIFDDWLQQHGYTDKTLQFVFNDLDPSDAVDFKKLLIELYDRKLISRSSLQLKMDLDPDIESAKREDEKRDVDLMDEKQIKPIVDMVVSGIMSAPQAKKILGIADDETQPTTEVQATLHAGNLTASGEGTETCNECSHYSHDVSHCRVYNAERNFDARACRFWNGREV
jgi:flagellar basal body-associated protein FliL